MLWNTIYHRGHRYDVRAADREAVQVEQKLMQSDGEATVASLTDGTIRQQNFNVTKIPSKQKAKRAKISSN
ncbi:hypothetical protein LOAG_14795 [Loa loa]|nr:hypothetical protein LOAG_14795 [Loa loa]EFO13736.1 hypothetical protein LOAG_14795 [Loa loa]